MVRFYINHLARSIITALVATLMRTLAMLVRTHTRIKSATLRH